MTATRCSATGAAESMEPNHGIAVADLRVLLVSTNTGQQRWCWWLVNLASQGRVDSADPAAVQALLDEVSAG